MTHQFCFVRPKTAGVSVNQNWIRNIPSWKNLIDLRANHFDDYRCNRSTNTKIVLGISFCLRTTYVRYFATLIKHLLLLLYVPSFYYVFYSNFRRFRVSFLCAWWWLLLQRRFPECWFAYVTLSSYTPEYVGCSTAPVACVMPFKQFNSM